MAQNWPLILWIVRHGQSMGNVARDLAHDVGRHRIELGNRDVDIPLSKLGMQQATALGKWFEQEYAPALPTVILCSPYLRAVQTAKFFRDAGGADRDEKICTDERLREKEFGILDGLTSGGVKAAYPDQAEFRNILGKFYHRPPGGESWCDVILRLRSLLDTISLHYKGQRVIIIAHQVVVLCLRYILENLDEEAILAIDQQGDVANCGVTEYRFDAAAGKDGTLALASYNMIAPMVEKHAQVTADPDPIIAARG
jgi:ribonuclease H / adenosylcobalamin/alpha-ribazole phosphatase